MSKLTKKIEEIKLKKEYSIKGAVKNFMAGVSYKINPIDTLKMITSSSIFGDASYYRTAETEDEWEDYLSVKYVVNALLKGYSVIPSEYETKGTIEVMTSAIDDALSYDFKETLLWAKELRQNYLIRLNPQIIMVRAALHEKRKEFTEQNAGFFDEINQQVMQRADDAISQMAYFLYVNGAEKKNMPSILKRSWAKKLSSLDGYLASKYKNHEIGLINAVRLCHANSPIIDELMQTGTITLPEENKTWEVLRSAGKGWKEIFHTVNMGHMALLRNLRAVFSDNNDKKFCDEYLEKLKSGVLKGKQFPFRYYSAYQAIKGSNEVNFKTKILDALEECMDIAVENLPKLEGKTICLSDNSGSAWYSNVNSEYGTNTVSIIDNLSSVMTAMRSDEGYVGKFGDKVIEFPISKRNGVLMQTDMISKNRGEDVGEATEGGIWEFFIKAIRNKEHYDNIFIYSDQQAGHGGLYGTAEQAKEYEKLGFKAKGNNYEKYIDVFKLVTEYRKQVNPKVNVFSVQTAGYDNSVIPEYCYRTNILYGWTGKEVVFAKTMIDLWNELDERNEKVYNNEK